VILDRQVGQELLDELEYQCQTERLVAPESRE
jgi:hypothetical protein